MTKKTGRQTIFAILFWAQIILLTLMLVSGTTYEIGQVLSLTSVSALVYPVALELVLGLRIILYGGIGFVILFGFYRRLASKKRIDQTLKDRLRQFVSLASQRMMIKKPVRPFILPGSSNAANTGRSRIVVGEKLVAQMSDQQLAGIIGHELAHGVKHHVLVKAMLFPTVVVLGIGLYVVTGSAPGGTILVWTIFAGLIIAEIPLSWKMEYSADHLSAELLGRNTMVAGLAYLRETHYDGPFFTHPPLTRRINRLTEDQKLQDMVFEVPVPPVPLSLPVGGPVLEKKVIAEKSEQVATPQHVVEPAKPRLCPICGVQVAIGQVRCGSCGTNLQQWRSR